MQWNTNDKLLHISSLEQMCIKLIIFQLFIAK